MGDIIGVLIFVVIMCIVGLALDWSEKSEDRKARKRRKDYEELKETIATMQDEVAELRRYVYTIKGELRQLMDDYFKHECMVVILRRDRQKIVAEIRKKIESNLTEGIE